MLCGYYGGAADSIVMRIIDGIMAFPQMVLAIAVAGMLGGGMLKRDAGPRICQLDTLRPAGKKPRDRT